MFFAHFGFTDFLAMILVALLVFAYFRMWRRARKAEKLSESYAGRIILLENMHFALAKGAKGAGQTLKG